MFLNKDSSTRKSDLCIPAARINTSERVKFWLKYCSFETCFMSSFLSRLVDTS